jgi:hypothetical protein
MDIGLKNHQLRQKWCHMNNPFIIDEETWSMFWTDKYIRTLLKVKELSEKHTPATFTELCSKMTILSKHDVLEALWVLGEWSLIYGEYGSTGKGRAGRIYYIDEMAPMWAQPSITSLTVIGEKKHE